MPNQPHDHPEQELSIKERSHELFLKGSPPEGSIASKSFAVHLRETAAQPFSALTKAILWTVGIIVAILFLATIWRIVQRQNSTPRPTPKPAASSTSILPASPSTIVSIAHAGLSAGAPRWEDEKFATRKPDVLAL
jgi:hypothetical protein